MQTAVELDPDLDVGRADQHLDAPVASDEEPRERPLLEQGDLHRAILVVDAVRPSTEGEHVQAVRSARVHQIDVFAARRRDVHRPAARRLGDEVRAGDGAALLVHVNRRDEQRFDHWGGRTSDAGAVEPIRRDAPRAERRLAEDVQQEPLVGHPALDDDAGVEDGADQPGTGLFPRRTLG